MRPPNPACNAGLPTSQAFLKMLRWLENYPRDDDAVYYATHGNGTFTDASSDPNTPHTQVGKNLDSLGCLYQPAERLTLRVRLGEMWLTYTSATSPPALLSLIMCQFQRWLVLHDRQWHVDERQAQRYCL